jgi:cold shock protein
VPSALAGAFPTNGLGKGPLGMHDGGDRTWSARDSPHARKGDVMATGKIKRMVQERGFGFISADDGREIFFHRSGVEGTTFEALREGLRVAFDVEKGQKGPRAVHVHLSEAAQLT